MAAKLGSVFELIGQTWIQRFDWTLKDELVIFMTPPKGDILLIPITALSSLFVNNTEVVRPIWLNATDKAQYRNIQVYGANVGLTATGPWSDSLYITALPTKFYVRKPLPSANQFSELCVAFEVY